MRALCVFMGLSLFSTSALSQLCQSTKEISPFADIDIICAGGQTHYQFCEKEGPLVSELSLKLKLQRQLIIGQGNQVSGTESLRNGDYDFTIDAKNYGYIKLNNISFKEVVEDEEVYKCIAAQIDE